MFRLVSEKLEKLKRASKCVGVEYVISVFPFFLYVWHQITGREDDFLLAHVHLLLSFPTFQLSENLFIDFTSLRVISLHLILDLSYFIVTNTKILMQVSAVMLFF